MQINEYGAVIIDPIELFEALYAGKDMNFKNLYLDKDTVSKFNISKNINKDTIDSLNSYTTPEIDITAFDKANQSNWFMPENYCPNLIEMLYSMCETQEQTDRVSLELELFIQHNMLDLLHYLKYLVDTMRNNKIVWGVGRGSSVASYCLFLIGIHKIDSIKYQLDIKEFLK
jgi:DNA polymerase III alpha subunit